MEIVWLRVPGCQVCNRKRPTAELGVTVSWHDELMSTCTAETLATCLAAVDEVPRSVALQTPMNSHSELKLDTLLGYNDCRFLWHGAEMMTRMADTNDVIHCHYVTLHWSPLYAYLLTISVTRWRLSLSRAHLHRQVSQVIDNHVHHTCTGPGWPCDPSMLRAKHCVAWVCCHML